MTDKPQIQVAASLFRAASEFQSKEEVRYYINGVYVQPHPDGGAVMVGTDGHRMLVAHDKEGVCTKPAIVQLEAAAYQPLGKDPELKLCVGADGIATCGHYRSVKNTFIDGTFPDWARVVKPVVELAKKRFHGKPQFEPASFNAKYISGIRKVTKALGEEGVAVRIVTFASAEPALLLIPSRSDVFGVLMPMLAECDPAVPAFMRSILEPKPAKKATRKAA